MQARDPQSLWRFSIELRFKLNFQFVEKNFFINDLKNYFQYIVNERNWVFATKYDFLIPISFKPDIVDLILSLKFQRFTASFKNIRIRKFEFVQRLNFSLTALLLIRKSVLLGRNLAQVL